MWCRRSRAHGHLNFSLSFGYGHRLAGLDRLAFSPSSEFSKWHWWAHLKRRYLSKFTSICVLQQQQQPADQIFHSQIYCIFVSMIRSEQRLLSHDKFAFFFQASLMQRLIGYPFANVKVCQLKRWRRATDECNAIAKGRCKKKKKRISFGFIISFGSGSL